MLFKTKITATTIQATINNVDIPLFQALFEKFRVKMIVVNPQKTYPIEKAIPNKETIEAIEEGKKLIEKHKKGLIKGHKSAEELFNEILSEDE